jgi:hypothetical protein
MTFPNLPADQDCLGVWRMNEASATDDAEDGGPNGIDISQLNSPAANAGTRGPFSGGVGVVKRFQLDHADVITHFEPASLTVACNFDPSILGFPDQGPLLAKRKNPLSDVQSDYAYCMRLHYTSTKPFVQWIVFCSYPASSIKYEWANLAALKAAGVQVGIGRFDAALGGGTSTLGGLIGGSFVGGISSVNGEGSINYSGTARNSFLIGGDPVGGGTAIYLDEAGLYGVAKSNEWVSYYSYGGGGAPPGVVGPVVTPINPVKNASGVAIGSSIRFTITDDSSIENPWTVYINRGAGEELAFTYNGSAVFEQQFQGADSALTVISNGYDLTIHPRSPFMYGQSVVVTVNAEDEFGMPATVA